MSLRKETTQLDEKGIHNRLVFVCCVLPSLAAPFLVNLDIDRTWRLQWLEQITTRQERENEKENKGIKKMGKMNKQKKNAASRNRLRLEAGV